MCKKTLRAFRADPRLRAAFIRVFAMVFAAAFVCSAIVAYCSPRVYFSTARIEWHPETPESAIRIKPGWDPVFLTTQFRIITSMYVFGTVITNLNLQHVLARQAGEPDWSFDKSFIELSQKVSVAQTSGTGLVAISVKNAGPNMAAKIANAMAGTYREYRLQTWKEFRGTPPGPTPAIDPVTIHDLARPSWNSSLRTKLELFSRWLFGGTLFALLAGGGGAVISLLIRPHCPPHGSPPL